MPDPGERALTETVTGLGDAGRETLEVAVIREVPLTILLNGTEIITLLTTPQHLDELAVGFLVSEGFLRQRDDLTRLEVDEDRGMARVEGKAAPELVRKLLEKRTVTSGCGKGTTFYHALDALQAKAATGTFTISGERIVHLVREVNELAAGERVAGGVHHAALADASGPLLIREDVGRHNAIDKIQGRCFLDGLPTGDRVLVSSGRISSEILIKASKMGVPVLVSLSKPTSLALELADRLRLTVVGSVRGRRAIIYRDFGRIT